MPVAHLVFENLLLLGLKGLADAQPTTADGAGDIANATFVAELTGDILIGEALLLEVNNTSIVCIIVGFDGLGSGGLASWDTDVALIGELGAEVGTAVGVSVLWKKSG